MSTYKRPDLLLEQLHCLLQQTYQHFEIIISDNDTEQSGKQAVDTIKDSRVKYFPNASNLGMVASFNKSIERSSGKYIVMITDDDPAYPHMLKDLVTLLNEHPGYGVYSGCGDWLIQNEFASQTLDQPVGTVPLLLSSMPDNAVKIMPAGEFAMSYLDGFFSSTYLLWSCMMVERSVLLEVKGMPDYGSELLTDHAYVIAVGSRKGFVYINKVMGGQVVHGGNFGYNIFKLENKYINTPQWFYDYLRQLLDRMPDWPLISKKIWNFAGRSWVEYSLQIAKALKNPDEKRVFRQLFRKAFDNRNIRKWKYKFYIKYKIPGIFHLLLSIKKIWK